MQWPYKRSSFCKKKKLYNNRKNRKQLVIYKKVYQKNKKIRKGGGFDNRMTATVKLTSEMDSPTPN